MSDQFHQQTQGWSPYQLFLGVTGVLSHWWLPVMDAINTLITNITFYGGALLIVWQVGKVGATVHGYLRKRWGN